MSGPTMCVQLVGGNGNTGIPKVVFLKQTGHWSLLGISKDLGIEHISAERVYVRYIFPNFNEIK